MMSFLSSIAAERMLMVPGSLILETRWKDAVFVGHFEIVAGVRAEEKPFGGLCGVGVEHEDLPEVGAGGAQQVEPVGHRFGQRLFVAKDDALVVVVEFAERDEAAALHGYIDWIRGW